MAAKKAKPVQVKDSYTPPQQMYCATDETIITYKTSIFPNRDSSNEKVHIYEYTQAKAKLGQPLGLTKAEIEQLLTKTFKIIESPPVQPPKQTQRGLF